MINIQNNIWSISSFLKNKQHNFNKKNILAQLPAKFIDEAILGISNWDNYSPTPLIKLNKLNEILKLKNINIYKNYIINLVILKILFLNIYTFLFVLSLD